MTLVTLYQAEWCPFSSAVRELLTELGIDAVIRQVEPYPEQRDALRELAGTDQIPVLQAEDGRLFRGTHEIFVYVRPTQTIRQIAFVTAFELGHAIDCGTMNDARRAEWAAIRGFPAGWTWFPGCLCTEDNFGSGDISMVFANWLVPNGGYRWRSTLAAPPSGDQLNRLMPYLRPAQVG